MTATREGLSAEALRRQAMNANAENEVLRSQVDALRSFIKVRLNSDEEQLALLERVAYALRSAREASRAIQSVPLDPTGHHTPHPNDRGVVGAPTRAARYQAQKLEKGLLRVVDSWHSARDNGFRSTRTHRPMTRCRNEGHCWKANRWVEAWDERGGASEFCNGCGHRLPPPDDKT